MPNFPTNLRIFDASSFEEAVEDPAIPPVSTDGGYELSRPRFTRRPRKTFSFKFKYMPTADKDALIEFWELVKGGSNAFNWTHPQKNTVHNVRFFETKLNFKKPVLGNELWESATINLKEV